MSAPLQHDYGPLGPGDPTSPAQLQFKKHKPLPRPHHTFRGHGTDISPPKQRKLGLVIDTETSTSGSQPSSPRTLKHKPRRIGTDPQLPPTPPTHSRTSSSSHSALPSSPTLRDHILQTPKTAPAVPPTTPPDQRSPPTPDVTPPQPASRPRALRPVLATRGLSRTTTNDSRNDSFKTAREEPLSSGEEDGKSTIRPVLASNRTSQTTIRKLSDTIISHVPNPQDLNMALTRLNNLEDDVYTPRTRQEFVEFDGDWGAASKIELELDDGFYGSVTVKLRNVESIKPQPGGYRRGTVEDVNSTVVASNATELVRHLPLNGKPAPASSTHSRANQGTHFSGPSNSDTSVTTSQRRSSGTSMRSVSSTVEVLLVDGPPTRQRTLRHVRKQSALRDPIDTSADSTTISADSVTSTNTMPHHLRPERGRQTRRHDSYVSTATTNSIGSGRARRDVYKNGGIPVVVIPDRRSSHRSTSREPSLRSKSSRRSKRTPSVGSVPLDEQFIKERAVHDPPTKHRGPVFERPSCRPRAFSFTNGDDVPPNRAKRGPVFERPSCRPRAFSFTDGDELTMDFPPPIPVRSSSLSAPTSRATSRAGSMTTESIRASNAIRHLQLRRRSQEFRVLENDIKSLSASVHMASSTSEKFTAIEPLSLKPLVAPLPRTSPRSDRFDGFERIEGDSHKRYDARQTPFSVMSVETNETIPEVSSALAVHMFPHQNSSVLIVNHSARPSEASDDSPRHKEIKPRDDALPVTPPQQPQFSLDDVDSPLRNPRVPPEPPRQPPALGFIPATPSGVTPGPDVQLQMGNFYESMAEEPPPPARRSSMVRRALSPQRRQSVEYPPNASRTARFFSRALSIPRRRSSSRRRKMSDQPPYRTNFPLEGETPPEENKLHPFWEPQWPRDEHEYNDDQRQGSRHTERREEDGHLKYPMIDNRPPKPKRALSAKLKRTFAILPIQDDEDYVVNDGHGTERRTIMRTSSGNLRVMERHSSAESLRGRADRPYTAPDDENRRSFWRGTSVHSSLREPSRRRRFSLSGQFEEIKGLSRRLSEKRREKRTRELRQQISGPKDVRDGVEDMMRSGGHRDQQDHYKDGYQYRDYQEGSHHEGSYRDGYQDENYQGVNQI